MRWIKFLSVVVFSILMVQFSNGELWAKDSSDEVFLDKIVVTSSRYAQDISEAASSISVITQKDIENSGSTSLTDILGETEGIVVRDFYGNGAKGSVDLRGFGDMDSMNNLVLIDGRRVNEVDLSGVDWSQIPLDQIEKIEVIRGGNSVLYGENAVGGVINIITKKGRGKPRVEVGFEMGSYDANLEKLSLGGSQEKLSYFLSASRHDTHGYRNNSFFEGYDYGAKLGYDLTDELSVHFDSGFHRATYGMPGGLSESEIATYGRRYSKYGDDRATDKDYYFMLGGKNEFLGIGEFSLDLSYRIKDVNSNLSGANGGWSPIRVSNIKTLGLTPKFTVNRPVLGKENNFILGFDYYRSFYNMSNYASSGSQDDVTSIQKIPFGAYLQEEFFLLKDLSLLGGFRYETVKYVFNYHDFNGWYTDVGTWNMSNEKAYNFGVNYKYFNDSNLFFNFNQSFRFPAVDEFFTGTLNTALKPQVSQDLEAGIRHNFNQNIHFEFSVYRMKIKDELYTDPTASGGLGATSNYGKTIHQGIDTSVNFVVTDDLSFYGNYSYMDVQFVQGSFGGKTIPWVPNQKANFGVKLGFLKYYSVNLRGDYMGSRYRINDVNNALPKVKNYLTASLGLNYKCKDLLISASMNNLFDQDYYEFASYGAFSGNKLYYPAPGRNFGLEVKYAF